MAVYVDGSALSRFLLDVPQSAEWRAWALDRLPELRRSELSVTELRRATATCELALKKIADALVERIREVRFSDQAIAWATTVEGLLTPFQALHFGVVRAEPGVGAIATYDAALAAVCHEHGLQVVTPGRPGVWWAAVVPPRGPRPEEQAVSPVPE